MKFILSFVFLLLSFSVFSQGNLKGRIVDSASQKPLGLATVTVFRASDTALITYRLSTPDGEFKVPGLPLDVESRVVISFSGYAVYRKEFKLDASSTQLDLGDITLIPDSKALDEVLLIAERPPVTVRKDTIEFNANSFKTLPTALVEDLLKKLPGVQVDGDGNITVNGKRVNRILVDGKEFFGDDPKMATRNLPANIIDKVQVTEDKDQKDLNPDMAEGNIGQVINLKLKKAIKKGWFGKAYAGAGTDDRYEAGTILNLFRDTMQVSLIGFSNNLNRAGFGFNDIRSLGGFDRSGINMMMMSSNGGINVNGISFGGTGEGINQSSGAGFNMNHVLRGGLTLNSQYFYGQTRNDILELNNNQQFFGNSDFLTRTERNEVVKSNSHRIGFSLKGKLDSLTRIDFRPGIVFSDQHSNRITGMNSSSTANGMLNSSDNHQQVNRDDLSYNHSLLLFRNFKKKGRTLNLTNNISYGRIDNQQVNEAENIFYGSGSPVISQLEQLRNRDQKNLSANLNANWNEPVSKKTSLRFGYALSYFKNTDDLQTYNKDGGSGKYEVPNVVLSNHLSRKTWRNTVSAGINWKHKALNITATGNFVKLDLYNTFRKTGEEVNQHFTYLLPGLNINWKEINFGYNVSVNPPGITDVQPTPDNSNPLYIQFGNPELEPAINHSFHFNYFKNITPKSLFISAYLNGNIRENGIVRARTINADGSQETVPVNIDGVHDFYTNFFINKQYKLKNNVQFTMGGGYNINFSRNYLLVNGLSSYSELIDFGPHISIGFNWKDIVELTSRHSRGFRKSTYQSDDFTDLEVNVHSTNTELVIRWPKNIVWEASLNYRYNSQAAPGIQKTSALLNSGVTFLFLKEQKGQLKLSAFDLLNENINVFRYTTENSIVDRQINILQRYFLLTFTYNIRNFKAGKVGGTQRFFFF